MKVKFESRFSIIIPVYNCNKFLRKCINSIIYQIDDNDEVILIDDGSTDNSYQICEEFAKKDNRIKSISRKNSGVSDTRNYGLQIASGKYICFLDADDFLNNGYIDNIVDILKKYENVELINFGFFSDVNDSKNLTISSDKINFKNHLYKSKNEIKAELVELWDSSMLYNIWNKVYLSSIIKENEIKFPNIYFGEDIEFNKKYLENTNIFYNSSNCFYHYIRERNGAVTKKYKEDLFDIRKNEFFLFNNYFEKEEINKNEYYEFSCRRYIERILGCIENIYCSSLNFKDRYNEVKKIINDDITRECLKYAKPKSGKIKLMLVSIRIKNVMLTMVMGKFFNLLKNKFPAIFNKLKNRR